MARNEAARRKVQRWRAWVADAVSGDDDHDDTAGRELLAWIDTHAEYMRASVTDWSAE